MAGAEPVDREARPTARPWSQQLVDAVPVGPAWVGIGLILADLVLGALYFRTFGIGLPSGWGSVPEVMRFFTPNLVMAALTAYLVAGLAYSHRARIRGLERLRPTLDCTDAELDAYRKRTGGFDLREIRRIGLPCVLLFTPLIVFDPVFEQLRPGYGLHDPLLYWLGFQNALALWLGAGAVVHETRGARLYA